MPNAIGFSDHSGWAVLAVVSERHELLLRTRIQTCPADLPRQVYHAVAEEGAPRSTVDAVMRAAVGLSGQGIAAAATEAGRLVAAGVAMGRSAIPADVERIMKAHTLLHAAEGELYRDALTEAAAGA